MTRGLTALETRFFGYIHGRNGQTVAAGDLVDQLGITPVQEGKLLSRLSRRGLIARVRRGLYLAPPRLPSGGKWSPSEALALTTLIEDKAGQYQVSGLNAFSRYGWDEQIPNSVFAYNNRISGERAVGTVQLSLAKVADDRLGATEVVQTPAGIELVYSSRARALLDAVYDWPRFNTLPRAFDWIRNEAGTKEGFAADLISVCLEFGNQASIRRIGKLLEDEGVAAPLLRRLERKLGATTSVIPWIPGRPKRGSTNRRWGVVVNDGR